MFFKLDLIKSYGSGICRDKTAMEVNSSPKLVFSPNNDTDDYTLAVAYINEEFAWIQEEEERTLVGNKQGKKNGIDNGVKNGMELFGSYAGKTETVWSEKTGNCH